MQDQGIQDEPSEKALTEEVRDSAVLELMLCDSLSPLWTVEELCCAMQDYHSTKDSIRRLVAAGLLHRFFGFVFPTRSARRAAEIEVGTV
jgi:hypothetical protein